MPIRIELGPRDIKQGQFVAVKRFDGEKETLKTSDACKSVTAMLESVQAAMFAKWVFTDKDVKTSELSGFTRGMFRNIVNIVFNSLFPEPRESWTRALHWFTHSRSSAASWTRRRLFMPRSVETFHARMRWRNWVPGKRTALEHLFLWNTLEHLWQT